MLCIVPKLEFQLGHPPLELHELHVDARLLLLQARDLLLNARILALLPRVVPPHLVFHLLQLLPKRFPHLPSLSVEHGLQGLLLRTQQLNLPLVEVQLPAQYLNHVVQSQQLRTHVCIRVRATAAHLRQVVLCGDRRSRSASD